MTLCELLPDILSWDVNILATDISEKALDKARRGVYERGHLDDLPPQWRLDYFDRLDDNNMAVKEHIKKQVIFAPLNLIGGPFNFKRQFHIIMCRNVMIYFDQKTKVELVNRFYDITAPGVIFDLVQLARAAQDVDVVAVALRRSPAMVAALWTFS